MKIAHVVCVYPPYYGGMGQVVFSMASELSHRGHEVMVFTPDYFEQAEIRGAQEQSLPVHNEKLTEQIETVKRLKTNFQYGNAARLSGLEQELSDFDIVHLHYPFFGTANLVRRWKKNHPDKKLFVTYHMDPRAPSWKGLIFSLYSRFYLPKVVASADRMIVSSFDYLQASRAGVLFRKRQRQWSELPFGVDTTRFTPRTASVEWRNRFSLSPSVPTVLFVGGMDGAHYFKGVTVLLQALYLLQQQNVSIQALFVGEGELRSRYQEEAKAMGIADMVRFVGRVEDEDLPAMYNLADLLILPSVHQGEAFGLVLLEAMASGVPVIASNLPGVRTVAEDGGLTFTPKDSVELSDKIQGFFSNENNQIDWQKKVRQVTVEKYSWEKIVDKLEKMYTERGG